MRKPHRLLGAISLILLAPAALTTAQPPEVASLTPEEAAAMSAEIAERVEEIRGLEFVGPVPVEVVDDATAQAHFRQRIETFMPEERLRASQTVYHHLGLLPEDVDLLATLFELLEEQAGGYYDPERETFFLLDDMPRTVAPILMAHELTHALDDQHFAIDEMLRRVIDDEDRTAAVSAVVEGSGTLVMTVFSAAEVLAGRLSLEALQELQESEAGKAEKMLGAPPVVQRSLLAPYILGQMFLVRGDLMRLAGGPDREDLDRAFREPPESFEQILHPEKYWDPARRDAPRKVVLPDLTSVLGEGWSVRAEGTLGELDMALLTGARAVSVNSVEGMSAASWTNDAAAGWGGDRWALLSDGEREVTVLVTLWDTVVDAGEFAAGVQAPTGVKVRAWEDAVVLIAGNAGEHADALAAAALAALSPAGD